MRKWRGPHRGPKPRYTFKGIPTDDVPPEYVIFFAPEGGVTFHIPRGWKIAPGDNCVKFTEVEEPDNKCILQLSVFRTPPDVDWIGLPLPQLLRDALTHTGNHGTGDVGEIHVEDRPDVGLVWTATDYIDPKEGRPATSRTLLARGRSGHVLITFAFWPEEASWCLPVWEQLRKSLRLDVLMEDPAYRRIN